MDLRRAQFEYISITSVSP